MSNLERTYSREIERNNTEAPSERPPLSREKIEELGKKVYAAMGIDPSEVKGSEGQGQEQSAISPKIIDEMIKAGFEAMDVKKELDSKSDKIGGLTEEDFKTMSAQYAASAAPEDPTEKARTINTEQVELVETPAAIRGNRSFKETLNTPVSELARETIQKIKLNKNKAFGAVIFGAAALALTACGGKAPEGSPIQTPENVDLNQGEDETNKETKTNLEYTGNPELDKELDGSFEQDDNVGCYEEKDKVTENSVGKPEEILKFLGIDPATATAEQWGEATQFMEYSMKYPAAANAVVFGIKGFENFEFSDAGIQAAEEKIANMNEEEKADFLNKLKAVNDKAKYKLVVSSGTFKNQAVEESGKRHSEFSDTILENTALVQKTVEITDSDGKHIGTINVYYKEDCGNFLSIYQEVKPDGTIIKHTISIITGEGESDGDKMRKDTTPDLTPRKHPHKNEEAEKEYAGEHVNPMKVDPNTANSESAHEKQESANRNSVAQQNKEDAERAAAAEQAAAAQQAAQQAAAAGHNTQSQVPNQAANAAANQAAAAQRAANEKAAAERAAAEQAAREQAAANEAAKKQGIPEANNPEDFINQAAENGF